MDPNKRFNLRINNENLLPAYKALDEPLSERSQKEPNQRPKNNKNHVHLFHKRNNTAITDFT